MALFPKAAIAGSTIHDANMILLAFTRQLTDEDAAGAAACAGCWMIGLLFTIAFVVLNVALLVWVARDAKARGMDSAAIWMLLVMFTSLLGLVIYILARPQGSLVQCSHCRNKRLMASAKCPHCGNA